MFRSPIQRAEEVVVFSQAASSSGEFSRIGLTDAALLEVATEETPLLTVDLDLYIAALARNPREIIAVNFSFHLNS